MANSDKRIIQYTSRDYESIMSDFWDMVPKLTELWQPEADSDPGVVLGKYLASVADVLGVNLDCLANEIFAPSVSQRKNAEKLFSLIGYQLGWYTAARTEVTFKNNSDSPVKMDFGFNGNNFSTLSAYTDITGQSRVITYNILPMTNSLGDNDSRSVRNTVTSSVDAFSDTDVVELGPAGSSNDSVTRVAIEGELRSYSVSVADIKAHNYIIKLPSQHLDTTAVWVKAKSSQGATTYESTQWVQCESSADFVEPEPRFAVTYDSYSNAQIQISNYLNQLENYDGNYLVIYWIDCSGVIGCVGKDVLQDFLPANVANNPSNLDSGQISISNLSNTVELPHTNTITGKSPETAKEAYYNSRKYINTWDSLITLPDFNRFLNREPGVDCGIVIDCQKALEINLAIYNDENLTDSQKSKMYITKYDFPEGDPIFNWQSVLDLDFDPTDPNKFVFSANFKRYTAMCFLVHNDFNNSGYGKGSKDNARIEKKSKFVRYKPPIQLTDMIKRDYRPLQAMSVELDFGWLRVFPWYVVGEIYPKVSVSADVGKVIINKVKTALAIHFSAANRNIGEKPTVMEVVNVIRSADDRIDYFDAGSLNNPVINWRDCDVEYFNPISFCQYSDPGDSYNNIRINPNYIVK